MSSKRRILVEEDTLRSKVDAQMMFSRSGVDVDFMFCKGGDELIEKLEELRIKGENVDIISVDVSKTSDQGGPGILRRVIHWYEDHPQLSRPKLFLHSRAANEAERAIQRSPDLIAANVGAIYSREFELIYDFAVGRPGVLVDGSLARFTNEVWGTNFPTDPSDIAQNYTNFLVHDPTVTNKEAIIAGIDLDYLDAGFHPELQSDWQNTKTIYGNSGSGISTIGAAAFDHNDTEALKTGGKDVIFITGDFSQQNLPLFGGSNGILVAGRGSEHLIPIADNHGFSTLTLTGDKHQIFFFRTNTNQNAIRIKNTSNKDETVIKAGDSLAIDVRGTYPKLLVGEHISVTKPDIHSVEWYKKIAGISPSIDLPDVPESSWYDQIMLWSQDIIHKHINTRIRANADSAVQVRKAISLGAEGIGLVRSEQILRDDGSARAALRDIVLETGNMNEATRVLKNSLKNELSNIFSVVNQAGWDGFPIGLRLLDAPTADYLGSEQGSALEKKYGTENTRGVQLGLKIPELYNAEIEAIFESAKDTAFRGRLEIMIPLVRTVQEVSVVKSRIADIGKRYGFGEGDYDFGVMIETVSACEAADKIAELCDFMSIGTYDLTKDVAGVGVLDDPLQLQDWAEKINHPGLSPDRTIAAPVAEKIKEAVSKARSTNPSIAIHNVGRQAAGDKRALDISIDLNMDSIGIPPNERLWTVANVSCAQIALERKVKREKRINIQRPAGSTLER